MSQNKNDLQGEQGDQGFFIFNSNSATAPSPDNSLFLLPKGFEFTNQQFVYSQNDGRIVAGVKKKN